MHKLRHLLTLFLLLQATSPGAPAPADALQSLRDGNARFVAGRPEHPRQDAGRRSEIAGGQAPFATILTCSDSRVAPEVLFDQGLGDLFIVRVAGNVADTDEIGTIEYGVGHLHSPLLVVMGHSSCGAVKAVIDGAQVHGSIPELVDNIVPAVEKTRAAAPGAQLFAEAVRTNVWQSIDDVFRRSAEVRALVKSGKLQVVGAVYDLATGSVQWQGAHPEQARLLAYTDGHEAHGAAQAAHPANVAHAAAPETGHAGVSAAATGAGLSGWWVAGGALALALAACGLWFFATRGMRTWTIGRRLGTAFGLVLALVSISAATSYVQMGHVRRDAHTIAETSIPALENIDQVESQISEIQLAMLHMLLARTAAERNALEQQITASQNTIRTELAEFEKHLVSEADRRALAAIQAARQNYIEGRKPFFDLLHAGRVAEATQYNATKLSPLYADYQKAVGAAAVLVAQEADETARTTVNDADFTSLVTTGLALASLVFSLVLAVAIITTVSGVLRRSVDDLSAGAEQGAAASAQVSAASQSLAEGSSE